MVAAEVRWEEKLNTETSPPERTRSQASREEAVVGSALWAAAGDAIGWITELSRGEAGVAYRTGHKTVSQPVDWQRLIGGRGGPRVDLPAGTYSDDTQLRLAVSRSIRGTGEFDVEAFAKVEVTVWPSYALGAGLGTKAAAANLTRRSVNWFSNFFDNNGQKYTSGGGNGAAMRIQPHVWASKQPDLMLINVLKDALVTHGHPHGFCGAAFHALCVAHALEHRTIPGAREWAIFIDRFSDIPRLISSDAQLAAFWQSAWESTAGHSLEEAIGTLQAEARADLLLSEDRLRGSAADAYYLTLERIGCLTPRFRGSGFKTALAAAVLAWLFRDRSNQEALVVAANVLESDTDTIGTMAGAILGCVKVAHPDWAIQDRDYIIREAERLAAIGAGQAQDSFSYPDLGHWSPPTTQTAAIGITNSGYALMGLGPVDPIGPEYPSGDAVWQWFTLPFGQTILVKRKSTVRDKVKPSQLPGERQRPLVQRTSAPPREAQTTLFEQIRRDEPRSPERAPAPPRPPLSGLDYWTDIVIQHEFDDLTIGRVFNRIIEETRSADAAVAFAAIIAKAKLARERRRRS